MRQPLAVREVVSKCRKGWQGGFEILGKSGDIIPISRTLVKSGYARSAEPEEFRGRIPYSSRSSLKYVPRIHLFAVAATQGCPRDVLQS